MALSTNSQIVMGSSAHVEDSEPANEQRTTMVQWLAHEVTMME